MVKPTTSSSSSLRSTERTTTTQFTAEDYVGSGYTSAPKRPLITQKPYSTTTAQTTTVTLTTTPAAIPTTTANSLAEPETLYPSRSKESRESSLDDDYGDSSSADFEFTTLRPMTMTMTTTSYYSRSSTTAETPPESQTLPSPPTVKPVSNKNPDESLSSGSGGLPNKWVGIRQRPGGTRGRQGQRRRPFGGRRPFKKPGVNRVHSTTTKGPTTETTSLGTTMETTQSPQQTVSLFKPLYTPSQKEDRTTVAVSAEQMSKETDLFEEFETPFRTTNNPTTTSIPATTKASYTTVQARVYSNIRPSTQWNNGRNTHRPPMSRIKPTVQSSATIGSADKELTFDTVTILTTEQGYINTPAPYNNLDTHNAMSSVYNHDSGNEATSTYIAGFEPTTKVTASKPKIVGGNAASFTILSNSDAFLPCEAVGDPLPDITWKRFSSTTGTKLKTVICISM